MKEFSSTCLLFNYPTNKYLIATDNCSIYLRILKFKSNQELTIMTKFLRFFRL